MPSVETILFALALTLLAGMSTGLGGLLTLVSRRQSIARAGLRHGSFGRG